MTSLPNTSPNVNISDIYLSQILISTAKNCKSNCQDCSKQLERIVYHLNTEINNVTKWDYDRQLAADLYTVVMLCIFAGIILLLMVRAISPGESVDDQVTILLSSMRARCDIEDNLREKKKMREAKRKAQKWLSEAKARSIKKLSFSGSFRFRSTSESEAVQNETISLKSNPPVVTAKRIIKPIAQRAASYQFLPEIVVTTSHQHDVEAGPCFTVKKQCRETSIQSCDEVGQKYGHIYQV